MPLWRETFRQPRMMIFFLIKWTKHWSKAIKLVVYKSLYELFPLRLLQWIHMRKVSWPPAWWMTVSTSWRSASAERCPAPASTACVPWSTTQTQRWSLTSGVRMHITPASFEICISSRRFILTCELYLPVSSLCPACLRLPGRFCIISCGRASLRPRCRISSAAWAVQWVWCRAAYSRASSTLWALRVPRTPRLLFW